MISKTSVDSEVGLGSDESDADGLYSHKYHSTKKWEWSYLRVSRKLSPLTFCLQHSRFQRECENLGLDTFYRHYIHRMQRSYLSLIIVVQAFVSISHIVILFIDNDVRRT